MAAEGNWHATGRRQFLKAAGAAAALGSASWIRSSAADDSAEFAGFKVGVQSYTFRNFKLDRAVDQIAELGLHHVEFTSGHVPKTSTPEQIKAVVALCKDKGITPIGFGVERFTNDHAANQRLFDFGKQLGIKYLSADPNPDAFDSLDKLVDEYKIAIAIHPHGPSGGGKLHRWYSAEIILDAVKDHHPLIGTCLDTGHLIRSAQPPFNKKLDPAQQILHMGKRNFAVHLKDHDNERRTDVVVGKANLDVAGVLAALKKVAFEGGLSIEYEANPDNPLADMKANVAVVREKAKALA